MRARDLAIIFNGMCYILNSKMICPFQISKISQMRRWVEIEKHVNSMHSNYFLHQVAPFNRKRVKLLQFGCRHRSKKAKQHLNYYSTTEHPNIIRNLGGLYTKQHFETKNTKKKNLKSRHLYFTFQIPVSASHMESKRQRIVVRRCDMHAQWYCIRRSGHRFVC